MMMGKMKLKLGTSSKLLERKVDHQTSDVNRTLAWLISWRLRRLLQEEKDDDCDSGDSDDDDDDCGDCDGVDERKAGESETFFRFLKRFRFLVLFLLFIWISYIQKETLLFHQFHSLW